MRVEGIWQNMRIMVVVGTGKIAVQMRNARMMMTLRAILVEGWVLKRGMPRILGGVRWVHTHRLSRLTVIVAVRGGKTVDVLRLL